MTPFDLSHFRGSRALVTGGMGFIGSNLVIALAEAGADVVVVDSMIPGYGGNVFNIEPVRRRVTVNFCDIRDANSMSHLVKDRDFVFHLAGQMDHVLSLTDPFPDIEINIRGTTVLMEALKHQNRGARVIYTGTRGEYGAADALPVPEDAPMRPKGLYEISNLTAAQIVAFYDDAHGIASTVLRLSNTYGPRAQMRHSRYGVANWFVRLALDGACLPVFGDGSIKRDFLYVDDCVQAILRCAVSDEARGQVLNVGVDSPTTFRELAEEIVRLEPSAKWSFAPFSPERKAQEPGDFYSDIAKIRRLVGWSPQTGLSEGLTKTLAFYREHRKHYWP